MQKDSMHFSTSGHTNTNQAVTQESHTKTFQCSHCTLVFKSKACLFDHLNKAHGFEVDAALRDAGLKSPGSNKADTDNNSSSSGNPFECQHCHFMVCSLDVLEEHEKQCEQKPEDRNLIGSQIISENPDTKITVISTNQQKARSKEITSFFSIMPTSKTKCTHNSSKDLKTYKRPLQTITKYFAASPESNGKPPVKLDDSSVLLGSAKGTLILQESPSGSIPNSSGVFKVTAKPTIDIDHKGVSHRFLLNDHLLITDLRSPKPKEQFEETVPNNVGKRTNNESSKGPPAKKAKSDKEETKHPAKANTRKQQSLSSTELSFEFSEDEEENTECTNVSFCKHCDYSDVGIRRVSTHYKNDHPYVRYNAVYIKDPSDQSATFRCLECPVEFLSVAELKRHTTENHPEAPDIFTMQSRELNLIHKCFVCPFTTNTLNSLKEHYREKHPTHKVDNSLMYCRYSVTKCQEGPPPLNTCEKAASPERPGGICPESARTPTQHPTSKRADVALYHCINCKFSHKSVVVMHVHYQKSHPDEAVTIDKIKQLACVTSHTTSQLTPDKSPNSMTVIENSTIQKNISDSSKKTKDKAELSQQKKNSLSLRTRKRTSEASETHSESPKTEKVDPVEDSSKETQPPTKRNREMSTELDSLSCSSPKLFYCQFCSYSSTNIKSVVGHHNAKHSMHALTCIEDILCYSAEVQKEKLKKEAEASGRTTPSDAQTSKQVKVCSEKELQHEEHETADQKFNRAFLRKTGNKKKKAKKLGKVSASPSMKASQTQWSLHCHVCSYSTQYVYLLKRHILKFHKANYSVTDVLRACFEQGNLQTGYYCHLCVFSHGTAEAVYEHYKEQHPGCRSSLDYITTRLYVGPETSPLSPAKMKELQMKHTDCVSDTDDTDGSLPSQKCGQNETKMYSCRACSFKGSSMSSITRHYRAVHPWSVKEDGSVLDVIISKKRAQRQMEDPTELPVSFDTYQVPLQFDNSPGSSRETTVLSMMFKCPHCPAKFNTQRGINTHCGMKHKPVTENLDEQKEGQIQTRLHVFKCSHCTYVNTNYQGVLTHCQMKHPALVSRADSLHVDEAHVHNRDDCWKKKGTGLRLRGYMCKACPQIYDTLEKMNEHCEKDHDNNVAKAVPNTLEPSPKPSAVSKKIQSKTASITGSVSKASFLSKKIYAVVRCQYCSYNCSTKIALNRHLQVCHKNASASKAEEGLYNCVLCSNSYFRKHRLGNHYAKKHGKEGFLKYFAPLYKPIHKRPAPKSPQPEETSEACEPSTVEEKKIVYRCPSCPYVNTSYHGILTHCQMRHPVLIARADELQRDEILVTKMVGCKIEKRSNERGYLCKNCPQMFVSLKKLKIHSERVHDQADATASEHSAEIVTEKQPDHGSRGSLETCQSDTLSVRNKESLYKCHICTYTGLHRRYLYSHFKKSHKLDGFTIHKLLQKYNKRNTISKLPEAEIEKSEPVKCKMCPDLMFDSTQLLIAHYSTFHSSDFVLDFIVLSQRSKRSTGLYKCALCNKQMNGIRKLCHHLDRHREKEQKKESAAETKAPLVVTPEAKSTELCRQDELPVLETVEELAQWNVTPAATFTLPTSPMSSPSKPTDLEPKELDSRKPKNTCRQCGRTFMSLKGLLSHERSHAALAAIKKLDDLSSVALKHDINKYVLYKTGTVRPFLCSFCTYRTTVMGLWRSHFRKKHQDVFMDPAEADHQDEESAQRADEEPPHSSEELNSFPELDEEPEIIEKSSYLEPPDVQRQLSHYNLMAQTCAPPKANVQETKLRQKGLLQCEICNFNTGHLSSLRRHYLNRHGKKIVRCKDCSFFTGSRKTLEMHMETAHSTVQIEPTHQKDLRCPFCLYQTKIKNNMIDHILLHREERVVPIEVRRSKLSRYLEGTVFRCHKCTFTSGSAENLRLHVMRHDDIKPYKCRLCYFDCTRLSDLEAHLSDKHQVLRNHELVGQVSLHQLEATIGRMPEEQEEPLSEVPHKTQAKTPAENNIREEITLQIQEVYQKQRQDGKNGNEESPTTVKEKHEQNSQKQPQTVFMPDTGRGRAIENIVGEGNNAVILFEDCNGPEKEKRRDENQTRLKLRESEDSSVTFTRQKEDAAEGNSTTYSKIAEKAQNHKLQIKALQRRPLDIEASVENDIHYILPQGEDGSIHKIHKKADQDTALNVEQNIKTDVVNEALLTEKESSIASAHNKKSQVNIEANKTHEQANNIGAPRSFKVKSHLLTLPNCAQLKINFKKSLAGSFTNCKKEHVHNKKNSEEVTDPYGKMPVLENEYLKEETHPLGCCKEDARNDCLEQKQVKEDENRSTNQRHEEGDGIKEADNPHVPKGALTVTDEAAEVLRPATTEKKRFTCEFCGRSLMNSSELERHVKRHGL